MAEKTGGAAKKGEGKKPHVNKPTSQKYKHYIISGNSVKRKRNCPRCGPGIFLAEHKDRVCCGKCRYTEFLKRWFILLRATMVSSDK